MATVYVTHSFKKEISKQQDLLKEIVREIKKYERGSKNLIDLYSPEKDMKVLKGYLLHGKIRIAILLRVSKKIYIPFFVAKKESKYGWNLSKYSEGMLISGISKAFDNIKQKQYEEYSI